MGTRADASDGGTPAGTVQATAEILRSPCWGGEKSRNFPDVDFLCPESPEHFRLTRTIIPSSLEVLWGLGAYFFGRPDRPPYEYRSPALGTAPERQDP